MRDGKTQWIAWDAAKTRVVDGGLGDPSALADWARAGAIVARARSFTLGEEHETNRELSQQEWQIASEGRDGFINWSTGELQCKVRQYMRPDLQLKARGIEFRGDQLDTLAPIVERAAEESSASILKNRGGRKRSEQWPSFVAELCKYLHDEGFPAGEGTAGAEAVMDAVFAKLAERGIDETISRSTAQPVVNETLRRFRAKN